MAKNPLKIGAKALGALLLTDFCPRCFWYLMHAGAPPFSKFPSIFNEIDRHTKRTVSAYIKQHGRVPDWMEFAFPGAVLDHETGFLEWYDEATDIRLKGAPDIVVHNADESRWGVGDFKTARYTKGQDSLLPLYKVQLLGYSFLLEKNGIKKPENAALFYFGPPVQPTAKELLQYASKDGFALPLTVEVVKIELAPHQLIIDLLAQVRKIYDAATPDGREGCIDCKKFDNYIIQSKTDKRPSRQPNFVDYRVDWRTGRPVFQWEYEIYDSMWDRTMTTTGSPAVWGCATRSRDAGEGRCILLRPSCGSYLPSDWHHRA